MSSVDFTRGLSHEPPYSWHQSIIVGYGMTALMALPVDDKGAAMLFDFFKSDETAKAWFIVGG